jgi:hypothetical protein
MSGIKIVEKTTCKLCGAPNTVMQHDGARDPITKKPLRIHSHDQCGYDCMRTQLQKKSDRIADLEAKLTTARGLLRELLDREPTEHCEILGKYDCVFCAGSKSDDGDDEIEHTPDCLITRAALEVEK